MIPSGKLTLPNGGILVIMVLQTIENIPEQSLRISVNFEAIFALITLFSVIFVGLKQIRSNVIGIIVQISWLIYNFKKGDFNNIYYLSTIILYALFITLLIINLSTQRRIRNSK